MNSTYNPIAITQAGNLLAEVCFDASVTRGWWHDPVTKEPLTNNDLCVPTKLMLTVSELAEAMEGHRKDKQDEHLPQHPSISVELADAVIRIADLCGALAIPLGQIIAEKLEYNAHRADHDISQRTATGGKAY